MPRITTIEDLCQVREKAQEALKVRQNTTTRVIIGMGTCGIAAGARETRRAVLEELERHGIEADVATVGCIGMCTAEPLVDIVEPGKDRITYGGMTADRVPYLIEEHLLQGKIIHDWVIGRIGQE